MGILEIPRRCGPSQSLMHLLSFMLFGDLFCNKNTVWGAIYSIPYYQVVFSYNSITCIGYKYQSIKCLSRLKFSSSSNPCFCIVIQLFQRIICMIYFIYFWYEFIAILHLFFQQSWYDISVLYWYINSSFVTVLYCYNVTYNY